MVVWIDMKADDKFDTLGIKQVGLESLEWISGMWQWWRRNVCVWHIPEWWCHSLRWETGNPGQNCGRFTKVALDIFLTRQEKYQRLLVSSIHSAFLMGHLWRQDS